MILPFCITEYDSRPVFRDIRGGQTGILLRFYSSNSILFYEFYSAILHHLLDAFVKLSKATISIIMPVCRHGTTRVVRDGFSGKLI